MCGQCNKAFTWRSDLITHQKIHAGVKEHKCDQCNKEFIQRGHLITHQKIHDGVKEFYV